MIICNIVALIIAYQAYLAMSTPFYHGGKIFYKAINIVYLFIQNHHLFETQNIVMDIRINLTMRCLPKSAQEETVIEMAKSA